MRVPLGGGRVSLRPLTSTGPAGSPCQRCASRRHVDVQPTMATQAAQEPKVGKKSLVPALEQAALAIQSGRGVTTTEPRSSGCISVVRKARADHLSQWVRPTYAPACASPFEPLADSLVTLGGSGTGRTLASAAHHLASPSIAATVLMTSQMGLPPQAAHGGTVEGGEGGFGLSLVALRGSVPVGSSANGPRRSPRAKPLCPFSL